MKKIIITLVITFCININAQITIGNIPKKEDEPKKTAEAIKPPIYDSINNIEINFDFNKGEKIDPNYYKKYIGLQFYHPPSIIPGMYSFNNEVMSYASDAKDKYYTLLDVLVFGYYDSPLMKKISHMPMEMWRALRDAYWGGTGALVLFQMKDSKSGDTLYCARLHVFILVPYFLRQKSLFENQILISDYPDFQENDLMTKKDISVTRNSRWKCSEVTLLKRNQVYPNHKVVSNYFNPSDNYEDEYSIFYILKNDKNETIALENLKRDEYKEDSGTEYHFMGFVTEKYYKDREQQNKLIADQDLAKRKEEEKKRIDAENARNQKQKAGYIKKYGQNYGEAIAAGNVKIGMTMEMCQAAWGILYESTKITNEQGTLETWRFMNMRSVPIGTLRFVNGILKEIVEH